MKKILAKDLKSELENNEITVLKVYADWCGPCKMLEPVMEEVSRKLTDVNFLEMDSDHPENREVLKELNVSSIPAVFYYKNKEIKNSHVGFLPAELIEEKIASLK